MKLKAKEPNARRKTEGNKDFKNLFNNCLWSSYCILSSDDLKINKKYSWNLTVCVGKTDTNYYNTI